MYFSNSLGILSLFMSNSIIFFKNKLTKAYWAWSTLVSRELQFNFISLIGTEHCEFLSPANQDLAIKYPLNLLSFWNSRENKQCSLYLNIS